MVKVKSHSACPRGVLNLFCLNNLAVSYEFVQEGSVHLPCRTIIQVDLEHGSKCVEIILVY